MASVTIATTRATLTHMVKQSAKSMMPLSELVKRAVLEGLGEVRNELLQKHRSSEHTFTITVPNNEFHKYAGIHATTLGVALMIGAELIVPHEIRVTTSSHIETNLLLNSLDCEVKDKYISVNVEKESDEAFLMNLIACCPGINLLGESKPVEDVYAGTVDNLSYITMIDESSFLFALDIPQSKEKIVELLKKSLK
jgi:hypothetical protein